MAMMSRTAPSPLPPRPAPSTIAAATTSTTFTKSDANDAVVVEESPRGAALAGVDVAGPTPDKIAVCVRVRGLNEREADNGDVSAWMVDDTRLVEDADDGAAYQFDRVFGPDAQQLELYEHTARPVVRAVMSGLNGTVFAYGQTGAGKTYTMQGSRSAPGIIPRALAEVFAYMVQNAGQREYTVTMSYLELYNEELYDLLAPVSEGEKAHVPLPVRECPERGIHVEGLREEEMTRFEDALRLLALGEQRRHVAATVMNRNSSRSHTIVRVTIESHPIGDDSVKLCSTLALVDLAGSERGKRRGDGGLYATRFTEGCYINKSLLTLGIVIRKLAEDIGRRDADALSVHVPYRNSRLTRLLQPALGGNAKAAVVCCVTPAKEALDETVSTLRFAENCRNVTNYAEVNEVVSEAAMLAKLAAENAALKARIHELESAQPSSLISSSPSRMEAWGAPAATVQANQIVDSSASKGDPSDCCGNSICSARLLRIASERDAANKEIFKLRAARIESGNNGKADSEVEDMLIAECSRLRSEVQRLRRENGRRPEERISVTPTPEFSAETFQKVLKERETEIHDLKASLDEARGTLENFERQVAEEVKMLKYSMSELSHREQNAKRSEHTALSLLGERDGEIIKLKEELKVSRALAAEAAVKASATGPQGTKDEAVGSSRPVSSDYLHSWMMGTAPPPAVKTNRQLSENLLGTERYAAAAPEDTRAQPSGQDGHAREAQPPGETSETPEEATTLTEGCETKLQQPSAPKQTRSSSTSKERSPSPSPRKAKLKGSKSIKSSSPSPRKQTFIIKDHSVSKKDASKRWAGGENRITTSISTGVPRPWTPERTDQDPEPPQEEDETEIMVESLDSTRLHAATKPNTLAHNANGQVTQMREALNHSSSSTPASSRPGSALQSILAAARGADWMDEEATPEWEMPLNLARGLNVGNALDDLEAELQSFQTGSKDYNEEYTDSEDGDNEEIQLIIDDDPGPFPAHASSLASASPKKRVPRLPFSDVNALI